MGNLVLTSFLAWWMTLFSTEEPPPTTPQSPEPKIVSYEAAPENLRFYWKDENGHEVRNFHYLKQYLKKRGDSLAFAMNGGMFNKDLSPQGLYIQGGNVMRPLDTVEHAYGNFYLQPNGVFYITKDDRAVVCTTEEFGQDGNVEFATQSGPLLLIDGEYHPKATPGSLNLHIRNGVGILPNGNVLFALSRKKINFHDLASFFKERGCKDALYLDGFVSRAYIPSKEWVQLDGNFGVIIAEVQ